ncbi:MAG: prepilin-type N-terminal cleavage/methylation domain-containing protein [Lachnospiraceae bacterium]|nr:prepilin-type N-terminal cleavage/methylation domain-containing protein [Lachnospiraceae bacterium]
MKKMNNKGFSLVELIIVIAIMAILIAVLAPQYIKYVEKSRRSADLDNYQAIINAVQTAFADEDYNNSLSAVTNFQVKGTKGASIQLTGTPGNMSAVLQDLGVDITAIKTKSSLYGNATLSVSVTNGIVKITCSDASLKKELGLN